MVIVPPDAKVVDFSIEEGNHHLHLMEKPADDEFHPNFYLIQELSGINFIKSGTFIVKETTPSDPAGACNDEEINAALELMKGFKPYQNGTPGANTWKRTFGGDVEYRALPGFKVVGFDLESENNHLHLMVRKFRPGETPSDTVIAEYSGMNRFKQGRFIVTESRFSARSLLVPGANVTDPAA